MVSIALAGRNSFAKNVLESGEETQLHIPKMKAPTFDGKITEQEWDHAAALSGPADIHSGLLTGDDQSDGTLRAIAEAFQIASEGSNKYVVVDAEEDKELKCTIDDQVVSVTLPVKARDYRMVRFEQHSPQ
jgi:hypothetical protein